MSEDRVVQQLLSGEEFSAEELHWPGPSGVWRAANGWPGVGGFAGFGMGNPKKD